MSDSAMSSSTGDPGIPNSTTSPPFRTMRKASRTALGAPDISKTTSSPAFSFASRNHSATFATSPTFTVLRAERFRELEAVGDVVRREDAPGAGGARDRDREEPDGAAAEHGHGAAGQVLRRGGEDRVPERLLQRRHLGRELGAVVLPDHRLRNDDELGERAVAVDAEDLRLLAHVRLPGAAVEAHAAGDVALGGDVVAADDGAHVLAGLDDGACELVPERQRRVDPSLRPVVPAEDVQVGPAHARGLDLHEHVAGAGLGNRDAVEREPGLRPELADRPHRLHRERIAAQLRAGHPTAADRI